MEVTERHVLNGQRRYEFNGITVKRGGVLTTAPWDGVNGVLLRLQVAGQLTVEEGGSIDLHRS